jgi:S-(hydroxymethyl)glutathione dehydrogenase/alcohol dehydrogenase
MAALISCGVPTGFGSAINAAKVRTGDTVVILGAGGIGVNAIQGAAHAGARYVIAIDSVKFKQDKAREFGATHAFTSPEEAAGVIADITRGQLADACIITTSNAEGDQVAAALSLVGKRGRVVVTALGHPADTSVTASLFEPTLFEKTIKGALFGSSNPRADIPRYLELYRLGQLKLDELVTREYRLEDINEGYQDMIEGRNIRGLIRFGD